MVSKSKHARSAAHHLGSLSCASLVSNVTSHSPLIHTSGLHFRAGPSFSPAFLRQNIHTQAGWNHRHQLSSLWASSPSKKPPPPLSATPPPRHPGAGSPPRLSLARFCHCCSRQARNVVLAARRTTTRTPRVWMMMMIAARATRGRFQLGGHFAKMYKGHSSPLGLSPFPQTCKFLGLLRGAWGCGWRALQRLGSTHEGTMYYFIPAGSEPPNTIDVSSS